MEPVLLTEGEDWEDKQLTESQVAALRRCRFVEVVEHRGRLQVRSARSRGWAGAIRLGAAPEVFELRIKPKVPISSLLFLVGYTRKQIDRLEWRDDEVSVGETDELLPAVAHGFARAARRALRGGPLRGYREVEESATVVRGRMREADQVRRHYSFSLPVEIRYDEHTIDILENRLLLAAARRLRVLPGVAMVTRTMLGKIIDELDGVSPLPPGASPPVWKANRLNARYHTVLGLADLVLRGSSYELGNGKAARADGLILLMDKLFEDFVSIALKTELERHGGLGVPQDSHHHLDDGGLFEMKPDLVYYRPDPAPFAVIDAKYKSAGRPDRDDMYQLVAYCTALGLRFGYIVSPGSPAERREHLIARSGITIAERFLDLGEPPAGIRRQIRDLAEEILHQS